MMPTMRGNRVLPGLVLAALTGCGLAKFDTSVSDMATIPGTFGTTMPMALTYGGSFANLDLQANMSFVNNGVKPGDVNSIIVKSAHLDGADPGKDNFAALLSTFELFVAAPDQAMKRLAHQDTFPSGASVDLIVDDPTLNLKPYATAPSMTISANVMLKQKPLFNTTVKTTVVLTVDPHL
jgi:hypothetical protein